VSSSCADAHEYPMLSSAFAVLDLAQLTKFNEPIHARQHLPAIASDHFVE
jgi:hypothetical protein